MTSITPALELNDPSTWLDTIQSDPILLIPQSPIVQYSRRVHDHALEALNYDVDKEREIEKWDSIYLSIRRALTIPGKRNTACKRCVDHISKFLEMFEGVAEIHFVAAGIIVSSLKAIMMLFQEYFAIDTQALLVLVSAVDVMRILFNLRRLGISEDLRSKLMTERDRIQVTLKSFGNVLDTFYKDKNLIKRLYKANDLTNKLKRFISDFESHKSFIGTLLSTDTNVGVQEINKKLDSLVSLFSRLERKVSVEAEFRKEANDNHIDLDNPETLLALDDEKKVVLMNLLMRGSRTERKEVVIGGKGKGPDDSSIISHFDEFVKTIKIPFDELCRRNESLFVSKFNLQTKQIQDSITYAKDEIIGEIRKGPYMRLKQKELREVWHEMGWVFCVKNKQFGMALVEYFLDHFSTPLPDNRNTEGGKCVMPTQSKAHPNAWTVPYMADNVQDLVSAIDVDHTGFIRISEANEFTDTMPQGWTFAEWCVYHGIGWRFEQLIYRERIYQLFQASIHQALRVLPENRAYVANVLHSSKLSLLLMLSKGPRLADVNLAEPLKSLVYQHSHKMDDVLRSKLTDLEYCIDAENTVHLLGDGKNLEKYILRLITLLLEDFLSILYIAEDGIINLEDLDRIRLNFEVVEEAVETRYYDLSQTYMDAEHELYDMFSGLYRVFGDFSSDIKDEDESNNHDDMDLDVIRKDILAQFPPPPKSGYQYLTGADRCRERAPPLYHGFYCDLSDPEVEEDHLLGKACYNCLECDDFIICPECVNRPEEDMISKGHSKCHPLVKHYYDLPRTALCLWIDRIATTRLQQFRDERAELASIPEDTLSRCKRCEVNLSNIEVTFICIEETCEGYHLCQNCEAETSGSIQPTDIPDKPPPIMDEGHKWWHTMLLVPSSDIDTNTCVEESQHIEDSKSDTSETEYDLAQPNDASIAQIKFELQAKMDLIEETIQRIEADLQEMKTSTRDFNAAMSGLRNIHSKMRSSRFNLACGTVALWVVIRYMQPSYLILVAGVVCFLEF